MSINDFCLRRILQTSCWRELEIDISLLKSTLVNNGSFYSKYPNLFPSSYTTSDNGSLNMEDLLEDLDKIPPISIVVEKLGASERCAIPWKSLFNDLINMRFNSPVTVLKLIPTELAELFLQYNLKKNDVTSLSDAHKGFDFALFNIGHHIDVSDDIQNNKRFVFFGCPLYEVNVHLMKLVGKIKVTSSVENALESTESVECWKRSTFGEHVITILAYRVPKKLCRRALTDMSLSKLGSPRFLMIWCTNVSISSLKSSWKIDLKKSLTKKVVVTEKKLEKVNKYLTDEISQTDDHTVKTNGQKNYDQFSPQDLQLKINFYLRDIIKTSCSKELEIDIVLLNSMATTNTTIFKKYPKLIPTNYLSINGLCKVKELIKDLDEVPPIVVLKKISENYEIPCKNLLNALVNARFNSPGMILRFVSLKQTNAFLDSIKKDSEQQPWPAELNMLECNMFQIGDNFNIWDDINNNKKFIFSGCSLCIANLQLLKLMPKIKVSSSLLNTLNSITSVMCWGRSTFGKEVIITIVYPTPCKLNETLSTTSIENLDQPRYLMVWSPKSIPENILQQLWNSSDLDPPKKVDYYLSGNKSSENIIQKSIQCLTKEEVQVDDHCLPDSLQQTNENCLAPEIKHKVNVPKKIKSKGRRYTRILKPVLVLGNSLKRSYRYAIKKLSNCGSKVCGLFYDYV